MFAPLPLIRMTFAANACRNTFFETIGVWEGSFKFPKHGSKAFVASGYAMNTTYQPIRRILPTVAVVGVLLFAGCGGKKEPLKQAGGQPPTVVDVMIVQTSQISSELEVNGEVAANEFVELHPEVSGRLTYLNVPEGGNVAQGTVIARINDADLQAQVTKTKVQLDLAKQTEARLKKLLDVNGVNQADYDIAVGQVNSLEADLNYSAALIEKTVVKAPFSGTLGLRQVSPGAYVTPATTLATLQQVQQLKVDFNVPEEFSSYIQKGDTVFIRTDLDQETRQTATVWAIEPQANRDTRNLKARAILAGDKANPGAFVKVYIARKGNAKSIMIPSNAIIPDAMSKKVVLVKEGKATFVPVETGMRQDRMVEVVSGLTPGDSLVVDGVLFARPNAPLKVRSVKQIDAK